MKRYTAQIYICATANVMAASDEEAERLFQRAGQDVLRFHPEDLTSVHEPRVTYDQTNDIQEVTGVQEE